MVVRSGWMDGWMDGWINDGWMDAIDPIDESKLIDSQSN